MECLPGQPLGRVGADHDALGDEHVGNWAIDGEVCQAQSMARHDGPHLEAECSIRPGTLGGSPSFRLKSNRALRRRRSSRWSRRSRSPQVLFPTLVLSSLCCWFGCDENQQDPALFSAARDLSIEGVPVPAADGPALGALANITPIRSRPDSEAKLIGYLRAGGRVARAAEPLTREGCPDGWYPVRPRGFVCAGTSATLNMTHPTMVAMSLQPKREAPLPYTFARVKRPASLFERDPDRADGIKEILRVPAHSGLAVIGSWSAFTIEGQRLRLGMTTQGQFIEAEALKVAEPSAFVGVELSEKESLPVGFVVKQGVHVWSMAGEGEPRQLKPLGYHARVPLTGRFRTVGGRQYWLSDNDRWVRHEDVTVVRRRNVYPEFAVEGQKWVDVSIITGTAVLYEGKKAVFTTLVSVGRDRLGEPKQSDSTAQGTFQIVGKHLTSADHDPTRFAEGVLLYDVPWVIELSSGQLMHASYSHDRFGIEHGPGNVQLSPSDAKRVWQWVEPNLPEGWHGVLDGSAKPTLVHVRQ